MAIVKVVWGQPAAHPPAPTSAICSHAAVSWSPDPGSRDATMTSYRIFWLRWAVSSDIERKRQNNRPGCEQLARSVGLGWRQGRLCMRQWGRGTRTAVTQRSRVTDWTCHMAPVRRQSWPEANDLFLKKTKKWSLLKNGARFYWVAPSHSRGTRVPFVLFTRIMQPERTSTSSPIHIPLCSHISPASQRLSAAKRPIVSGCDGPLTRLSSQLAPRHSTTQSLRSSYSSSSDSLKRTS